MKTIFTRALMGLQTVCVLLVLCTHVGAADRDVLLVLGARGPGQVSFVRALRIQLGSAYDVRVSESDAPQGLPARLAFATELVASESAFAAVWMEEAGTALGKPQSAVLYVVGRRAGRALLEVVEAAGDRGLDLERMLSLKLSELLAELHEAVRVHAELPPSAASVSPRSLVPPVIEPSSSSLRWHGTMRLGGRFDAGVGHGWSRFGLAASVGPALIAGAARVGVGLGAELYPAITARDDGATVSLMEVTPRLLAELAWQRRAVAIAFHAGPELSLLSVRGATPRGASQTASERSLGFCVGIDGEHAIWRDLALAALIELHASADRLRLGVNGMEVLDRGWLRLTVGIELRFRIGPQGTQR